MNRVKVLIVIDWFLPGTASGGPVRSFSNLIDHLDNGFEFFVVTRNTDYRSEHPYEGIEPNCWVRSNDYTSIFYFSKDRLSVSNLKKFYKTVVFDIAMVNGIYSWYFSILPLQFLKKLGKPVVVSARGMLNPQAFSVKGYKKQLFLSFSKFIGLYKGVRFHATNEIEAENIRKYMGKNVQIQVAPNLPRKSVNVNRRDKKLNSPTSFVSVARIAKEKGTLTMLKAISALDISLRLDLYGPIYDSEYWLQCQQVMEKFSSKIKVAYNGIIESKEVPALLEKYNFFVLLSEGENFGHAILEGLSAGCPVIISDQTPWKDLEKHSVGWDVNIKNPDKILGAFKKALNMSPKEYEIWSRAAFDYATEVIHDEDVLNQNLQLLSIDTELIS